MDIPSHVYLHIPFCRAKCPYCSFYSISSRQGDLETFIKALERDITDGSINHDKYIYGVKKHGK